MTIKLSDRQIIEISGNDAAKFLQGLITNDINKSDKLIYSAMLNNQGRFLYDFFIFKQKESYFLDSFKQRTEEIARKLNFFKLKSDVTIKITPEINIYATKNDETASFYDPRNPNMPNRLYTTSEIPHSTDQNPYHQTRILNKIPESEHDLTYEKSIINEFNFDELNAIDYEKGCYIGQELTARTHHLGEIRKKIYLVTIPSQQKIEKNHEISCNEKKAGIILSSRIIDEKLHALALIKTANINETLTINAKNAINIIK